VYYELAHQLGFSDMYDMYWYVDPKSTLQHTATHCNTTATPLQRLFFHMWWYVEPESTLQHTATHCNTTATAAFLTCGGMLSLKAHCNTLQHHCNATATPLQRLLFDMWWYVECCALH